MDSEHTLRQATLVNQERLAAARIGILGSNSLADACILACTGLGIEHVSYQEFESQKGVDPGFLTLLARKNQIERIAYADTFNYFQDFEKINSHQAVDSLDFVIDCTQGQEDIFARCQEKNIAYVHPNMHETNLHISAQVDKDAWPKNCAQSPRAEIDLYAGLVAGIIGQMIVAHVHDTPCAQEFTYACAQLTPPAKRKKERALIIGAGATGTHTALHAALAGYTQVDILDADDIQTHNMNRQSFYIHHEGEIKAEVLSATLRDLGVQSTAHPFFLTKETQDVLAPYTQLFSCVDLYSPRKLLSVYAHKTATPLFDTGTSAQSGRVNTYIPGNSPPLHEQINLDREDPNPNTSCSIEPSPSIIMPNMVIGSLAIEQACNAGEQQYMGTTKYDRELAKVYRTKW